MASQDIANPPQPPSPNGISAASILATLADSRPLTSHEEEEEDEELDDDVSGGIALAVQEQVASYPILHSSNMAAPHSVEAGDFLQHYPLLMTDVMAEAGLETYSGMDQHAAALEYLSMTQIPTPASLAPSIADGLLTLPSTISPTSLHEAMSYEADSESASFGQNWSGVQDGDKFQDISTFYRQHIHHPNSGTLISLEGARRPSSICREDLRGDSCDYQGIDWSVRRTTRSTIRAERTSYESNRIPSRLQALRSVIAPTRDTENFFSFRRMNTQHRAFIHHFQLRNLLASTSRNDVFYATGDQVNRTDASGTYDNVTMDLSREFTEGYRFMVTTLAASDDILIAGGFEGEYALTDLSSASDTKYTVGRIAGRSRNAKSHIMNHMHLFNSRHSYTPQVAFCSNDEQLRILDCYTNTFTHSFHYSAPVNCSATSPNGRMRVVVGDFFETLITNAETGQPFERLHTHDDGIFACDWADDGIHVATAAQDTSIVIWDARNWSEPLRVMHSELSVPRCVKFSPVGGGPRVLVSAEADDYVSIIDAQTFESKQVFDYFGRTAGISMTRDGSSLFIANVDPHYGGIIELERCAWGEQKSITPNSCCDWMMDEEMHLDNRVVCGWRERQRRGLNLGELMV
ncbi:WD40-repeat-containing domain protein [Lophiotrema nucula]|uniref:WD40-repeat-containing domain protein n=1 Tax=Lophiotrema nucula TaxID=690887 RepID=A0A6A5ZH64_9PLEO|nr:WD40-repeat-containing domain protein [Lophiotrema nucula]